MSKFMSTILVEIASVLITVCVISAGVGGNTATSSDDPPPPPPTTTQPTTEGNPWHG